MKSFSSRVPLEAVELEVWMSQDTDNENAGRQEAVEAFTRLLHVMCPSSKRRVTSSELAVKVVAVAHLLGVDLLGGRSLRDIERSLGIDHGYVCRVANRIEREIGFRTSRRGGNA